MYFTLTFDVYATLTNRARWLQHRPLYLYIRLMDAIYHTIKIPWQEVHASKKTFDYTVGWQDFTSSHHNHTTIVFHADFPNETALLQEVDVYSKDEDCIISSKELGLRDYLRNAVVIGNVSLRYMPRIDKAPFPIKSNVAFFSSEDVFRPINTTRDEINHICRLYGTPHANVLHQINIVGAHSEFIGIHGTNETFVPKHKIFCGVFTTEAHHASHVKAILETWGQKCHLFIAFSTAFDPEYHAIPLPHLGAEEYHNMWQKTRAIWKYLNSHYLHDFDYFLLGGDDMFYIMENLHAYLQLSFFEELRMKGDGIYLGKPFHYPIAEKHWYNTGGPGYLLDQAAIRKLIGLVDDPRCHPLALVSIEDVLIGQCLLHASPPVYPLDTRDSQGRSRFHFFSPGYLFRTPQKDDVQSVELQWIIQSDPHLLFGVENCCDKHSISFHFVLPDLMYMMYDFLYNCPKEVITRAYQRDGEKFFDPDRDVFIGRKNQ